MPPRKDNPELRVFCSDEEIVQLIPALRAFARTFYRNREDADDLVQETLTKAISAIHQFSPGTSMKSWLFTIMRNAFYTRVKIARREAPGAEDCISARPAVEATQEWTVRGRELEEALGRLRPDHRELLVMVGVAGVSYEDAAQIYGCAIGTIKSRLNRARQRLLFELGEDSASGSVRREGDSFLPTVSS
jgi:RNA polymerase sigma factor (sigma-70 family)